MANGFGVGEVKKEKHWNDKNNTPITPQQEANLKKAQGANPTKYIQVDVKPKTVKPPLKPKGASPTWIVDEKLQLEKELEEQQKQ